MADGSHTVVNRLGQAPDTYREIRDELDNLVGDLKNVEGGLQCVTIRESETRGERLDPDFVSALYALREMFTILNERGAELVERMCELERRDHADPALEAYRAYVAACAAADASDPEQDVPDELVSARIAAYDALMAAEATTNAGVAAKLKATLVQYEASEIEDECLTVPLADLERIIGEAVRS